MPERERVRELLADAFDDPHLTIAPFQSRPTSRLYRVTSPKQGRPLIAKEVLKPHTSEPDLASALDQYQSWEQVAQRFKGDEKFGNIETLPVLVDQAIIVSVWLEGRSMSSLLADFSTSMREALSLMTLAGMWLQRFHAACAGEASRFDVRHRWSRVSDTVAAAPRDFAARPIVRRAMTELEGLLARVDGASALRSSMLHGDFTTDNLMVTNDGRVVGHDYSVNPPHPIIFDLEQFLHGIDLDLFEPRQIRFRPIRRQLEAAFRRAYSPTEEVPSLPEMWLRLMSAVNRWGLRQSVNDEAPRRFYFDRIYTHLIERMIREIERAPA